tara:strand:+ start:156 stop:1247 length:1092 start_codon:yes stop_codon:yes gene_type:complete
MNVCLIGNNLTTLSLAKNLTNKNIKVFNYAQIIKNESNTRTIGITNDNLKFFNKEILNIKKKMIWDIEKIDIYSEKYKKQKILNFDNNKKGILHMVKNDEIYDLLEKDLKKNTLYKKIYLKNNNLLKKIIKKNFDLIINCDQKNIISKELFFKKIKKNYNSKAFTCIINHKSLNNKTASQIFTKYGPIAFLPISNSKTSIVFSIDINKIKFTKIKIIDLINYYNFKYKIKNFSEVEGFDLSFSVLRNYFQKNILAFGDIIHTVHPLAGQGFNISLRDLQVLSKLIQKKIDLGLPLDISILQEFEKNTKHLNYFFTSSIDFIYEFFKFDNKIKNNFSNIFFKIIDKNKNFNKFFSNYANKGLVL